MPATDFDTLVASLPSLRKKAAPVSPWDATRFLRWLCTTPLSHGELLAGRFVLGVWNRSTDWVAEAKTEGLPSPEAATRFDVLEAAALWDDAHLAALRAWLERPSFP